MATLRPNAPVAGSQILAYGGARGNVVVTNDDIAGPIDSSDEWIRQRTGITTRRRASADVSVVDLAKSASLDALAKAPVEAGDIDAIICATITFEYHTPSLATLLGAELGIKDAVAYDISAACAGFCYAIGQADALVRAGAAKNVLVVGAEKLSDIISPTDRTISFLLGDGAGAAIVSASEQPKIGPTVWGSDGEHWKTIRMSHSMLDFRDRPELGFPTIEQEGRTVFRWAVWHTADIVRKALSDSGLTVEDIDVFVPHQANMRIIDELAKQLKLPESVVIGRDIADTGNTSAASVPLAVSRLIDEGRVKSGDVCVQIGFGAGLAYAGQVVVLP